MRGPDRGTPRDGRVIKSRYDAAQVSDDTRRWWANADNLSARAANSPEVRKKLRDRTRYEVANNSYASGIANTLSFDLIGTGPRVQVATDDQEFNVEVEARWRDWSDATRLPEKLRIMRRARAVDGEGFGLLETNRGLRTPSKLDLRVIEADQVSTPFSYPAKPADVDGIRIDRFGYPLEYYVLRGHPGDDRQEGLGLEYSTIPARYVLHWFRPDRPQQYRGVPEFTPALDLFAKLRRYTLAVIAAAETAADYAGVLQSDLLPDQDGVAADPPPVGEAFEIERGMMVTLPAGQKLQAFKAEQPTTTFEMFEVRILKQICRCLGLPYFVAAGDYADINFSSGRLGSQGYLRDIEVERDQLCIIALDLIFAEWLADMRLRRAIEFGGDIGSIPWRWLWPAFPYFDPETEAKAKAIQLENGLTTFTDECHSQGVDAEERVRTMASDRDLFVSNGFLSPYQRKAVADTTSPEASRQSYSPSSNGRH